MQVHNLIIGMRTLPACKVCGYEVLLNSPEPCGMGMVKASAPTPVLYAAKGACKAPAQQKWNVMESDGRV